MPHIHEGYDVPAAIQLAEASLQALEDHSALPVHAGLNQLLQHVHEKNCPRPGSWPQTSQQTSLSLQITEDESHVVKGSAKKKTILRLH